MPNPAISTTKMRCRELVWLVGSVSVGVGRERSARLGAVGGVGDFVWVQGSKTWCILLWWHRLVNNSMAQGRIPAGRTA